jgi:hypothetical protein
VLALAALLLPLAVVVLRSFRQLGNLLRSRHPAVWASLSRTGLFEKENSLEWYVWSVQYLKLGDPIVSRAGDRVLVVQATAMLLLFAVCLAFASSQELPSCLVSKAPA